MADPEISLLAAVNQKNSELALALIKSGADVRQSDEIGVTSLHQAGKFGMMEVVRALVAAGADVNAANRDGVTPLIWAAARSKP
jgi:ankyrin repeat protein